MDFTDGLVNYEAFGAVGDGIADDLPAICKAHDYANANGMRVRARHDATYHLGRQDLTAIIGTSTDWNTARFVIDDREVDNHRGTLFDVRSLLEPVKLEITSLVRDQKRLDLRPETDLYVKVESDAHRVYIREGLNQNAGTPLQDCFILRRSGAIESPIDWDYPQISKVEAWPMDPEPLTLSGGVFTTIANCMVQEVGYNYWGRNIEIHRSNTEVVGLVHYVVGETNVGHPYRGFLSAVGCANITFRDCFVTPHRIYQTQGAVGKPVSMGSYDLHANFVVNFHMVGCRMNHLLDHTRWGIIGSNFCKSILLEDCQLSRMDTHMGVSGGYTIRRCTLGWMGLNAIGRDELLIEDSTIYGDGLVKLRGDYGATWQGDITVRNTRWIPRSGLVCSPHLIASQNSGLHDFGYPCSMPHSLTLENVTIEDMNHPADYTGPYLFTNPDNPREVQPDTPRPHPYARPQKVTLRNVTVASGLPLRVCPNPSVRPEIDSDVPLAE